MIEPRRPLVAALVGVSLAAACSKKDAPSKAEPSASASAAPAATESAAAVDVPRPADDAVCAAGEEKVWGKWANRRTGITPAKVGSKVALGVAFGNKPAILTFDAEGRGELVHVKRREGSALDEEIPAKKGQRDLQRVTPVSVDGKLTAYADYRDKYAGNERRRIACELVGDDRPVLVFDGKPLLEKEKDKADTADYASSAAVTNCASTCGCPRTSERASTTSRN